MVKQLRPHLTAGSWLALACAAAIAMIGVTAVASAQHAAASAAVGAVYTETNDPSGNSVVVFDRLADGTLEARAAVSTGGKGSTQRVGCGPGCPILDSQNEVVVSNDGKWVFAVNAGSNTVSSLQATSAGLKLVSQASSGGTTPESLALHGSLLYVLNVATENSNKTTGNIYGLRVSSSGNLSPLGSSQPLAHAAPPDHSADPRAMDIDPTGKVIVVTELAAGFTGKGPPGAIDTFVVGSNGKAGPGVSHPSSDAFPFGFAFDGRRHLIVSNIHNPTNPTAIGSLSSYTLSDTGSLIPVNTLSARGIAACWVVITKDNRHAFVVNQGGGHPAPVTTFGLSTTGELSSLGAAASLKGEFARSDEALSRDSKFVYVLAPSVGHAKIPSQIDEYRVGSNGSLTLIGSTPGSANLGNGASGLAAR